jgi:Coenzyme PQQ synthesis protein D (PqqD)
VTQENYRIRRPEVVSEVFDGEAVIVNLRRGRYYAMTPLATALWSRFDQQPSFDSLVASGGSVWTDPAVARRELRSFVDRLLREELIESVSEPVAPKVAVELLPTFADPVLDLEVFTDLEDLLLLDPIHDLDEGGWPVAQGVAIPEAGE